MKPTERILAVFVLFGVYTSISCRVCDLSIDSFASEFVLKRCAFSFHEKSETKYIGFEFRLTESKETRHALETVKANFRELSYSPLTRWNGSCDCNEVPCLNEEQLNDLFISGVKQAFEEAKWRIPFMSGLCCSVQRALVEIFYRLDEKQLARLKKCTLNEIDTRKCTAYLTNELRQTEWCDSFKTKCENVIGRIFRGCEVTERRKRDIGIKHTSMCGPSACYQGKASVLSTPLLKVEGTSYLGLHDFANTPSQSVGSLKLEPLVYKASLNSVAAINSGSSDISRSAEVYEFAFRVSTETVLQTFPTPSPRGSWTSSAIVGSNAQSLSPFTPVNMTSLVTTKEVVSKESTIFTRAHNSTVRFSSRNAAQESQSPTTASFWNGTSARELSTSRTYLVPLSPRRTTREANKHTSEKSSAVSSAYQSTNSEEVRSVGSTHLTFPVPISTVQNVSFSPKLKSSFLHYSSLPFPVPPPLPSISLSSSSVLHSTPFMLSRSSASSVFIASQLLPSLETHLSLFSHLPSNSSSLSHLRMTSSSHSTASSSTFLCCSPSSSSASFFSSLTSLSSLSSSSSSSTFLFFPSPSIFSSYPFSSSSAFYFSSSHPTPSSSSSYSFSSSSISTFLYPSSSLSVSLSLSSLLSSSSSITTTTPLMKSSVIQSVSAPTSSPIFSSSFLSSSSLLSSSSSSITTTAPLMKSSVIQSVIQSVSAPTSSPTFSASFLSSSSLWSSSSLSSSTTTTTPLMKSSVIYSVLAPTSSPTFSSSFLSSQHLRTKLLPPPAQSTGSSTTTSKKTLLSTNLVVLWSSISDVKRSLDLTSPLSSYSKHTFIKKTFINAETSKRDSSQGEGVYFSHAKTGLTLSSIPQTLIATPSKPSTTVPAVTDTFLMKFQGNCSFISNREEFKYTFVTALTEFLPISRYDVIVYDVKCGSVDVTFGLQGHNSNLTEKLWAMIANESIVFTYNGTQFVAFYLRQIITPSSITVTDPTTPPSVPTGTSTKHGRKRIVFIIFVLIGSVFGALFIFCLVVFVAKFCTCCQKTHRKFRVHRNVRMQAPFETELKRFVAHNNILQGVNFYGELTQLEEIRKDVELEIVEDDIDEELSELSPLADTNIGLLNSYNHTNSCQPKEHKFVFDDAGSCSSVVFY